MPPPKPSPRPTVVQPAMPVLDGGKKVKLTFLQLPGEIRTMIYYYLHNELWRYGERSPYSTPIMRRSQLSAQMLSTNRQVHDEASKILYGSQPLRLNIWSLGPSAPYADPYEPLSVHRYFPLIRSIEISIIVTRIPEAVDPELFSGARWVPQILLDGIFTQSAVKHVNVTFYFSGLPDVSLQLLCTGDLQAVPPWERGTVTSLFFYTQRRLLYDPVEQPNMRLVERHGAFGRLEAWTRRGQLRWMLEWEDRFDLFSQYPGEDPISLLLDRVCLPVDSVFTLHPVLGAYQQARVSIKVEFRHRPSLSKL